MADPTIQIVRDVLAAFDPNTPLSLSYIAPSGQKRTARIKGVALRVYDDQDTPVAEIRIEPRALAPRG